MSDVSDKKKTKCDKCGLVVVGEGADPTKHYNNYQWAKVVVTGMKYNGDDGSSVMREELDVCPKCFRALFDWFDKGKKKK